jgi:hypothetical protein
MTVCFVIVGTFHGKNECDNWCTAFSMLELQLSCFNMPTYAVEKKNIYSLLLILLPAGGLQGLLRFEKWFDPI